MKFSELQRQIAIKLLVGSLMMTGIASGLASLTATPAEPTEQAQQAALANS